MNIKTSRHSYEVKFLQSQTQIFNSLTEEDFVVTDSNLYACYSEELEKFSRLAVVPAGEQSKSLERFGELCCTAAQNGLRRDDRVVAFGGGVVGDLAGYVAASYMRGVDTIQVPTSLLAMVDSSVGGKVAIDLPEGKNLVGAFWPPAEVLVCPEFLSTLDDPHFTNGMAEVIKYGWIMDSVFLKSLLQDKVERDSDQLEWVIRRCIELKSEVVSEDEFETTGRRAILNFGHTIGHAIEKVEGYKGHLHGEAISIGMVLETQLAENLGIARTGLSDEVAESLQSYGLPVALPKGFLVDSLLAAIKVDKKSSANGLAFSLISQAGECKLVSGITEVDVRKVLSK